MKKKMMGNKPKPFISPNKTSKDIVREYKKEHMGTSDGHMVPNKYSKKK